MTRFGWLVNNYNNKRVIAVCYVEFANNFRDDCYTGFANYEERENFVKTKNIQIFTKEEYILIKRSCAYVRKNHEWECINAIRKLKMDCYNYRSHKEMLKIGSLHEKHNRSILDIAIFEDDKLHFEDFQEYECDELARYFCDTRGIILVTEKDYSYLTTNFFLASYNDIENHTRMYLTDKGYKLPL